MAIEPAWSDHYCDEMDAAWLYRALAHVESNPERRAIFDNLARVEDEHVERWRMLFQEHGGTAPAHAPSMRSRLLAGIARVLGSGAVLPLIIAEESREVGAYLRLARGATDATTHATAVAIAAPSPSHAEPVTAETAAAAKAAPNILPSRPRSMTPARSENIPANAASSNGVATRMVAASTRTMRVKVSITRSSRGDATTQPAAPGTDDRARRRTG